MSTGTENLAGRREAATKGRAGRNYLVVSTDTHAGPATFEQYLSYVDPKYRDDIASHGAVDLSQARSEFGGLEAPPPGDEDLIRAAAIRKAAGMSIDVQSAEEWFRYYTEDLVFVDDAGGKRLKALEDLGVHAEVTYPNPHLAGFLPRVTGSFSSFKASGPRELLWPAIQGYNRWLADFCSAAPGRRAGIIQLDLDDMNRAVSEVKWAREAGIFGGISLPPMSWLDGLPGYADSYYDPLWAACTEHEMVVNIHTGGNGSEDNRFYDPKHGGIIALYEVFVFSRRPLWFLLLGGVFDRHPALRVAIAENGSQWLPSLIRDLDLVYHGHAGTPIRARLKLTPGEYLRNHVWLAGSVMQRYEAEMRREIGIDRMMWGSDYPHLEGAPPVHRESMRHVLGGLPEDDIRQILGTNALAVWPFDEGQLQAVADQVGPTVDDLRTQVSAEDVAKAFGWSVPRHAPTRLEDTT